jgi:putative transcriptional regulator
MQSMLCLFRKVNLAFPLPDAAEDKKENSMKTKIRELRKKHKLSQEELAEAVGTTRQTITSIEVGKYTASLPLAYKIAHYFGLTIEEVFDFSDLEE